MSQKRSVDPPISSDSQLNIGQLAEHLCSLEPGSLESSDVSSTDVSSPTLTTPRTLLENSIDLTLEEDNSIQITDTTPRRNNLRHEPDPNNIRAHNHSIYPSPPKRKRSVHIGDESDPVDFTHDGQNQGHAFCTGPMDDSDFSQTQNTREQRKFLRQQLEHNRSAKTPDMSASRSRRPFREREDLSHTNEEAEHASALCSKTEDEPALNAEVIDLTDEGVNIGNIIDLDDIISSDDDVQIIGTRKCKKKVLKKKRIQQIRRVIDSSKPVFNHITIHGVHVKKGCCVEFDDGTFMKVHVIYADKKREFMLVGNIFTRITDKEVLMPRLRDSDKQWGKPTVEIAKLPRYIKGWKLINEVCQRIKVAAGEANHDEGLWLRSAQDVKRQRKLIMTNQPYENNCMSRREINEDGFDEDTIKREGQLICRWKETITTNEYGKVKEHRLERPTRQEVLPQYFLAESNLRARWRGSTLNLESSKTKPVMVEGFCGAGGMTSGALNAGMDIKFAFDYDSAKIATHEFNFPQCLSKHVSITEWIEWTKEEAFKVDVIHLSPPCQPFSAANTTPNWEKNEQNEAVLLACGQAIECLHPRIVTIEESDGLANRHGVWFGALLSQLTELGFSVRWACLQCSDFGVPQTRTRIFLIASAPGEDLPTFPKPTHPPGTVSVQTMLNDVARHHEISPLFHHNPESMPQISKLPYDPQRLAKCITCKGGDNNYHPDGRRPFTIREFLALQTFWHDFRFPPTFSGRPFTQTEMKIQLGNAVPPLMGAAIMRSVIASLTRTDRRRLLEYGGGEEADAIELW